MINFLRDENGKRIPNPNLKNVNLYLSLDFFEAVCSEMGLQKFMINEPFTNRKAHLRNTYKLDESHYLEFHMDDPLDVDFNFGSIINDKKYRRCIFSLEEKEDVYTILLCLLDAIRTYWRVRDGGSHKKQGVNHYKISLKPYYYQYEGILYGENVEWHKV